jgi:hypothetical protein
VIWQTDGRTDRRINLGWAGWPMAPPGKKIKKYAPKPFVLYAHSLAPPPPNQVEWLKKISPPCWHHGMAQMAIRVSGQRQKHGASLADEIAKWLLQFSGNLLRECIALSKM